MRAKVGVRTKVGIVSFAHMHAHNYAAALGNLGGIAEFVGIADEDSSRGRVVAEQYGVPYPITKASATRGGRGSD